MIRKLFVIVTAAAVVAAMAPPSGAFTKKPPRTVRTIELAYQCPCGVKAAGSGLGTLIYGYGGVTFPTEDTERYLSVSVEDVVAQTVAGQIAIDTIPGNLEYEDRQAFCGSTEQPFEIVAGTQVDIYLYNGTCEDAETVSLPTAGTVTVVLSNQP